MKSRRPNSALAITSTMTATATTEAKLNAMSILGTPMRTAAIVPSPANPMQISRRFSPAVLPKSRNNLVIAKAINTLDRRRWSQRKPKFFVAAVAHILFPPQDEIQQIPSLACIFLVLYKFQDVLRVQEIRQAAEIR